MKNINTALKDFMTEHIGIYHNPHGVEFTTDIDNAICVGVDYPGETFNKYISLELVFESETIAGFVMTFQIKSVSGLDNITPQVLLDLFHQGKVGLYCLVENGTYAYDLMFKKKQPLLMATDEKNAAHEVPELLETPQQFIVYTQRYYHVHGILTVVR